MSTQLFLRLAASDLGGAGQQALSVTRGAASHTAVTNTTASGTNIQVTATAAGQALTWFSPPLAGSVGPIAGSITVNIWGFESSASANAKAGITIEHTDSLGNVLSTIVANTAVPTTSSEYGLTPGAAKNASFTPTSTALNYGDRIKVTLFVKNQGTMGGGFTVTNSYDGPTAAAAGDTYVTFTENLFPAYSGGPQGWSSPAGIRAVYLRTGLAMASQISPVTAAVPPTITTTSLPNGITGQPYSATVTATGGTIPYTWSILSGSLPAGLSLNSSTGAITGTPTGSGVSDFTVKVTDANSNMATQFFSVTITSAARPSAIQAGLPQPQFFPRGRVYSRLGAPLRNPNAGPAFRQRTSPVQARFPLPRRGRTGSNPGGPVHNPVIPPVVRLPHGPVQAKLLPPPRRGRMAADWGVILFQNPQAGPAFTQATKPSRARITPPPRGRIASSPGKLVVVPRPAKVYPLQSPVRARVAPPFSKGRTYSHLGAPLRNPGTGPVFRQVTAPARARIIQPARGQVRSNPGAPVVLPPPAAVLFRPNGALQGKFIPHRRGMCRTILFIPVQLNPQPGPAFRQAATSVRIRPSLPPRGRTGSNPGGPVRNPVPPIIAIFRQAVIPARIRSVLPPRGRTYSHPGAPLRNPQKGPVFRQATQPARIRPQMPPRGRIGSNPGTGYVSPPRPPASSGQPSGIRVIYQYIGRTSSTPPYVLPPPPPPPPTVAPFIPRTSIRARLPLPRRGICRTIRFCPVPANPGSGPVFTQAKIPARARITLPPRGRIWSSRSTPFIPPSPPVPAVFRQAVTPPRIWAPLPPRGRIGSNPGGPVVPPPPPVVSVPVERRSPVRAQLPLPRRGICRTIRFFSPPVPPAAPPLVYPQKGPVRAAIPQVFSKGRVGSNPGTTYPHVAPFRQAVQPARIRPSLPPRGRIGSNPGSPPPPPPVPAKIYPAQGPVRFRITLPPRGRVAGNPGAPVRNPQRGPVFRQAVRPIRGIIPQNAPRGRSSSNPGGPVENIPFATLVFSYGSPHFAWKYDDPHFEWTYGNPHGAWAYGIPQL